MSFNIEISLIILIAIISIAIIVLTIFIAKFIHKLTCLTENIQDVTNMVNKELKPIMSEFAATMKVVNNFAQKADNSFFKIKKVLLSLLGVFSVFGGGLKNIKNMSGSFMKGIFAGFKMFSKK